MVSGVTLLKVCSVLNGFWCYVARAGNFCGQTLAVYIRGGVFFWQQPHSSFWLFCCLVQCLTVCVSIGRHLHRVFISCHRIWFVWLVQFTCFPVCFHWETCPFPPGNIPFPPGNMSISTGKLVHFSAKECVRLVQFPCFPPSVSIRNL